MVITSEETPRGSSRVLVIETQTLFGKALAALLTSDAELDVVSDVHIADLLSCKPAPDVVIFDLDAHDGSLRSFVDFVRSVHDSIHLCAIAANPTSSDLERCLDAGVEGLVLKDALPIEFIRATKTVAKGDIYVDPTLAGAALRRRLPSEIAPCELTTRETEIVRLIAEGLSNKEIGVRLTLSEKTVKSHLARIFSKLKISGRTRAAVHAIKAGLA